MAPDLNSLPPSRPLSNLTIGGGHPPSSSLSVNPIMEATRRHDPSPSPRSSSISLAAAATMNAGIQSQRSRRSSSSISGSSRSERPSNANITSVPTSASTTQSLRALPSTNIGDRDPTTGRRRSSILMNLQLANPGLPAAGEMQNQSGATVGGSAAYPPPSPGLATGSPMSSHYPHHRQPSLGEMHQELETEQEAAVNRLLGIIARQQTQISQLREAGGNSDGATTPTSERSTTFPVVNSTPASVFNPRPRSPGPHPPLAHRPSTSLSRQSSRRSQTSSSRGGAPGGTPHSPALHGIAPPRHQDGTDVNWTLGSRDESAFHQAESQMLTRENQMLKVRIRELERQIVELGSAGGQDRRRSRDGSSVAAAAAAGLQNSPVHHSGLTAPPITRADSGAGMTVGNGVAGQERGAAVEKDEVMN